MPQLLCTSKVGDEGKKFYKIDLSMKSAKATAKEFTGESFNWPK
jgi:hypothetical protein